MNNQKIAQLLDVAAKEASAVEQISLNHTFSEEDAYECPRNLIFTDLDNDGMTAGCFDGDGTSRSIMRVPR